MKCSGLLGLIAIDATLFSIYILYRDLSMWIENAWYLPFAVQGWMRPVSERWSVRERVWSYQIVLVQALTLLSAGVWRYKMRSGTLAAKRACFIDHRRSVLDGHAGGVWTLRSFDLSWDLYDLLLFDWNLEYCSCSSPSSLFSPLFLEIFISCSRTFCLVVMVTFVFSQFLAGYFSFSLSLWTKLFCDYLQGQNMEREIEGLCTVKVPVGHSRQRPPHERLSII